MPNALPCKARVIRRKARLPKSQSPGVEWRTPPGTASDAGAAGIGRFRVSSPEPSRPADDGQRACSRGQKGRLSHARYVQRKGNSGWPKGREPYGHGGSVVVVRVTPHRGGRESRPHGRRDPGAQIKNDGEVREMRDAAAVLEITRDRGRRGLPLERLYRCLFNPDLFLLAYGKIYRNAGAMTPGATGETVDGMTLGKIEAIIGALQPERYRWTPVRRTLHREEELPKKRPLGLPTWSDKLLARSHPAAAGGLLRAAVLRPLPRVPPRPRVPYGPAGDHSQLARDDLVHRRRHHRLFRVLGPLGPCSILAEKIHDGRFLRLIDGLLRAGYLEEWRYHADAERLSARRGRFARPFQYLPGPAGQVYRADPAACPQPGRTTHAIPALYAAVAARLQAGTARRTGGRPRTAQADEDHALPRPRRSGLPAAALLPLRRRLCAANATGGCDVEDRTG